MRFYRGHIYAWITVLALLASVVIGGLALVVQRQQSWLPVIMMGAAFMLLIIGVICSALAFHHWMPKWERDEKKYGHVPGEPWVEFGRALGHVGEAMEKPRQTSPQQRREGE